MNCTIYNNTHYNNITNCTNIYIYSNFDIEVIIILVLFVILCFCGYKYYYVEEKKTHHFTINRLQIV